VQFLPLPTLGTSNNSTWQPKDMASIGNHKTNLIIIPNWTVRFGFFLEDALSSHLICPIVTGMKMLHTTRLIGSACQVMSIVKHTSIWYSLINTQVTCMIVPLMTASTTDKYDRCYNKISDCYTLIHHRVKWTLLSVN